jgi:succinyl-CoA synthetase alpha subunit
MSILVHKETRVVVQGITGTVGRIQTKLMLDYGTNIVAGVTPGKGGEEVEGIPVYNAVSESVANQGANASVILVPPFAIKKAILEAIEAGVELIVVITEHVPVHDIMELRAVAKERGTRIVGPNSPGIITPGEAKMGIMPGNVFSPGRIGIVSRSGTLSYEVSANLSGVNLGQSTMVGIGGEPVIFSSMPEILGLFNKDPDTDVVVILGEVGGAQEEKAAQFIAREMTKPVVACIVGYNAPDGKRMGHAGALVQGSVGTHQGKVAALQQAGVPVASSPLEVVGLVQKCL